MADADAPRRPIIAPFLGHPSPTHAPCTVHPHPLASLRYARPRHVFHRELYPKTYICVFLPASFHPRIMRNNSAECEAHKEAPPQSSDSRSTCQMRSLCG